MKVQSIPKILTGESQLGPYPMGRLERVDEPTIKIVGKIARVDSRESGFSRALRGDFGLKVQMGFEDSYPLARAIQSVYAGMPAVGGSVLPDIANAAYLIPDDLGVLTRNVKAVGYFMGADVVGVCRIPEYAFYSHDDSGKPVESDLKNAIVIVIDQGYKTMNASSGKDWMSNAQSFRGYTRTAFTATIVASYIRQLGHTAEINPNVIIPPLLLMAGMGEIARNGIVLNPFLGQRFKAAVVATDMSLEADKPVDFGLQDFCKKCKRCAVECPAQAISHDDEKIIHNGYEKYAFNAEGCTRFRLTNPGGDMCGRCIKVCPWNKQKGWTHDVVRWMVQRMPFMNDLIIRADELSGYGQEHYDDKWWLDVAE